MLFVIVALFNFALTASSPLPNRIINGTLAPHVPWIANILPQYQKIPVPGIPGAFFVKVERDCGGSVIASNWVLTARHCIYNAENELMSDEFHVSVGSNNLNFGEVIKVIDIVLYSSDPEDDLALLKLETIAKNITPVKVQYEDNLQYGGRLATIYGWGQTEQSKTSTNLKQTNVQLVDREQCGQDRYICFDPSLTHSNACRGDSGGPMIVQENGETRLIGVAHAVYITDGLCAEGYKNSLYISTAHYGTWIQSVIG